MLTAFTARPLVELKQRDKSKIEALLTYGNRLLIGLSTGVLRVYRINEPAGKPDGIAQDEDVGASSSPPQPTVELLREVEKFSRRAVEQLAMIKEANILLSLSDGYVSMHDLQDENYQLREQLSKTKGASTFAVASNIIKDPSSGIPSIVSRLAVAVKRKVLLWSWHDTELSSSAVEVTLSAPARTLTWATGMKLICGLNSGYVVVNVENRETSNILSSGGLGASAGQDEGRFGNIGAAGMGYVGMGNWVPKPLATTLTDGELLLAKDVNTLFVDQDFKPLDRRQIQWTTAPDAIAFSYPYLLALQGPSRGVLEVRNPKTLSLLQSIVMPNASRMHVPQPNVSLAHAGKGFLVASSRCLWRMTAELYDSQIEQLLEKGLLDEAISLIEMLEDPLLENKQERLREIKMQKAENLFQRRRYRAALDLFTEVSAPPERVIRLYPRVVAGDLAAGDPSSKREPAVGTVVAKEEPDGDATAKGDEHVEQSKDNAKGQEDVESKAVLEKTPSKASKGEPMTESSNASRATTSTSLGASSEDALRKSCHAHVQIRLLIGFQKARTCKRLFSSCTRFLQTLDGGYRRFSSRMEVYDQRCRPPTLTRMRRRRLSSRIWCRTIALWKRLRLKNRSARSPSSWTRPCSERIWWSGRLGLGHCSEFPTSVTRMSSKKSCSKPDATKIWSTSCMENDFIVKLWNCYADLDSPPTPRKHLRRCVVLDEPWPICRTSRPT